MKKLDNQLAPALLGAVSEQKKSTEQLKRERDLKEQENNPKEQKECPSLIVEILKKLGRYEEAIDKCFEYVEEKYYLYDYARKIAKKYVPARQAEIANSIMKIGIKR
jgi:Uma2 family endonuclease